MMSPVSQKDFGEFYIIHSKDKFDEDMYLVQVGK